MFPQLTWQCMRKHKAEGATALVPTWGSSQRPMQDSSREGPPTSDDGVLHHGVKALPHG